MEESNFMTTLLILGPASPGKDFDLFLEPLVEDLLKLWSGVRAYDGLSCKIFNLCDGVLWCIHDYKHSFGVYHKMIFCMYSL
jgi:hypothetical protein